MFKLKWALLIVFLAGVLILVLPDDGKELIKLNKIHGPSFQDIIGLALISLSWVGSIIIVCICWGKIKTIIGTRNAPLLLFVYLFSCIGIAIALKTEADWILWPCVAIALFINILFVFLSFKKNKPIV